MYKTSIEAKQAWSAKVDEARALMDKVIAEKRDDFSDEERQTYIALMGEGEDGKGGTVGKLSDEIRRLEALEDLEREKTEIPDDTQRQKPDNTQQPNVMKRSEFDKLEPKARHDFVVKQHGTVVEE